MKLHALALIQQSQQALSDAFPVALRSLPRDWTAAQLEAALAAAKVRVVWDDVVRNQFLCPLPLPQI